MSQRTIARSYARALSETLPEPASLRVMEDELAAVAGLLSAEPELRELLTGPRLALAAREELASKVLVSAGASEACRNFVALLVRRYRLGLIAEISEEFSALVRDRLGIVDAEVVSARPLTAEQEGGTRSALAKLTGREVRARFRVDSGVLGGLWARVGDTVYDGSVRGKLERMRERISSS